MVARIRFRFPRSSRLNRSSEFRLVKARGKSWTGKYLVLSAMKCQNHLGCRIGIITSRRLGSAVARNKIRRRIREIFRLNQYRLRQGVWLVAIARISALGAPYQELEQEWLRLAERASILAGGSHGSNPADHAESV